MPADQAKAAVAGQICSRPPHATAHAARDFACCPRLIQARLQLDRPALRGGRRWLRATGARLSGVRLRHRDIESVQRDGDQAIKPDEVCWTSKSPGFSPLTIDPAWRGETRHPPRLTAMPRDRLRGWGGRTRTQKCRRKLSF